MKLKTLPPTILLFFMPWLVFFICGTPAVAPYIKGALLSGVVLFMAACPLLTGLFVHSLQKQDKPASPRTPIAVGLSAALINSPVILLCLFISLHRASP